MKYEKWDEVLAPYEHAVQELKVKFKNIRDEFLTKGEYSPIEFVTGRTKKISSIISKANRLEAEDIEKEIEDIAGIRIMCQFVEDIYTLVDLIKSRTDMTVIQEKDYITNFKESGYRSLHLIIEVPIFLENEKKNMKVEVQLRTIAMDFWASLEHKLRYKKDIPKEETELLSKELVECARISADLDSRMEQIRNRIIKKS